MLFFAGLGPILSASNIIVQGALRQDAPVYGSMLEHFEYLWEFYFPSLLLFSLVYPRERRLPNFALLGLVLFAPYIFHLATIMSGQNFSRALQGLSSSKFIHFFVCSHDWHRTVKTYAIQYSSSPLA